MPDRTCIGCRTIRPQKELIRLTYREGHISLDQGYADLGRGAYLCRNAECLELAIKKKAFGRAFRSNIFQEDIEDIKRSFPVNSGDLSNS